MTDLDTNQNDCPFCGDHVEGRIIKEYGTVIGISEFRGQYINYSFFCLLPGFRGAKSFVKAGWIFHFDKLSVIPYLIIERRKDILRACASESG